MDAPPISRYPVPRLEDLPEDIRARMLEVQEKAGFIPNVFLTLAHRPDEFRAFFAYHDALMLRDSGLTKAEREMIVVATSGANDCLYCIVAHGAILRVYAKNPLLADQVAVNYRKADISDRQKAMLGVRAQGGAAVGRDRRKRFRRAAGTGIPRRGHLGHRRDRGVFRAFQSHGQPYRHAAERRVLFAGKVAQNRTLMRRQQAVGCRSRIWPPYPAFVG